MTTLTVRGLPDRIVEQLKARARTRRRSLEAELREILLQAASQPLILDALAEADRIAAMTPPRPRGVVRDMDRGVNQDVTRSAA